MYLRGMPMRTHDAMSNDVLIADDDRGVVSVLEAYLEGMGVFRHIVSAKDGVDASKKLLNQKFVCILLDINMPKKSGVELIREFEQRKNNSIDSVIVVSGGIERPMMSEMLELGVRHFLVKPFEEGSFVKKVTEVLAKVRPDLLY